MPEHDRGLRDQARVPSVIANIADTWFVTLPVDRPVSRLAVRLLLKLADAGLEPGVVGGRLVFVWSDIARFNALSPLARRALIVDVDRHRDALARLVLHRQVQGLGHQLNQRVVA